MEIGCLGLDLRISSKQLYYTVVALNPLFFKFHGFKGIYAQYAKLLKLLSIPICFALSSRTRMRVRIRAYTRMCVRVHVCAHTRVYTRVHVFIGFANLKGHWPFQ